MLPLGTSSDRDQGSEVMEMLTANTVWRFWLRGIEFQITRTEKAGDARELARYVCLWSKLKAIEVP